LQELVFYATTASGNRTNIEDNINNYYSIYAKQKKLLDAYGGAAAAYSLRRLNSLYTGPLVKIRRDSDNVEVNVYPDFEGNFSLNSIVTNVDETTSGSSQVGFSYTTPYATLAQFVKGNPNCFVVEWKDQSGNGNHATQTTGTDQPKIYDGTTGVATQNGKPSISTLTGQGLTFTAISLNDLSTFIIGNTPSNAVMLYGNANATRLFFPSTNYIMSYSGITNGEYTAPAIDTSNSHLRTLLREDGVSESVYYDGSQLTQIVQGGSGQINVDSLGPIRPGDANRVFQEIIIYTSDQSTNRTNIEDNINTFYNIY
jgi:hypothetical protein